ncbi:hypothetical protein [Carnobacterium sp. TMP28]|uniref:hypothetical protein n=1 Tax=Carnobacterium sp. TMP28 TaxID=3397060 RepID=UPI0039E16E76
MYLISGTLVIIASFFIFISNYVLNQLSYTQLNAFIALVGFISLFMGAIFYYVHYAESKKK